MSEKTMTNVAGKLKSFNSLYERMKDLADYSYKTSVDEVLAFDVFDKVIVKFEKFVS